MVKSKYESKLQKLVKKPTFTSADARDAGIPSRMLCYLCDKGIIQRINRGVYKATRTKLNIDFEWEDLALVAMSIPKGVICLISALCYYRLTDQIMREFWIAIPHASWKPKIPKTRIIRMRNLKLGQTKIRVGNYSLKIFDRERTVIDAFRYLSEEVAIKALQAYLHQAFDYKPDLNKLIAYAKQLRIDIHPYIKSLTT
ncbi:MAG: type IV toxin-antitoxin system AbiEi family antitoxin domain-containing protein [Chlamydiota bacterium]